MLIFTNLLWIWLYTRREWVYVLGDKVFNMLPSYIKIESDNLKKFKLILQKFLNKNFFFFDEYFELQKT